MDIQEACLEKSEQHLDLWISVQGTNDSSVLSKASAAAQGYFRDAFIQHFVCRAVRRSPLINRGYYVRWRAVDHCVRRFLQTTDRCPRRQILSLGAGFDSLFFRLHADALLDRTSVFELDFPDVAHRKAFLIQSNIFSEYYLLPSNKQTADTLSPFW
uniref:[Phosphatase 2A protein]-leucine-carboxy methyltransferase 1 n=1 Tax=Oryzias sinensis TaxID=183150 RepID=A0A8C7WV45_9TELE